jgi:hypothetical protein
MPRHTDIIFIECQRCRHKAQRTVPGLPLPAGARFRCSRCHNREQATIKVWHTGGSSAALVAQSSFSGKRPRS